MFSTLQESWSKVSHATGFSVTFFVVVTIVGQLVKMPPPQQKVSQHITALDHTSYSTADF